VIESLPASAFSSGGSQQTNDRIALGVGLGIGIPTMMLMILIAYIQHRKIVARDKRGAVQNYRVALPEIQQRIK
jgi:hypothetical protein